MADDNVVEFHSRDLDSNLTAREAAAVNDWKSTNYTYHVMRDHIYHNFHIQAGMFGKQQELAKQTFTTIRGVKVVQVELDQTELASFKFKIMYIQEKNIVS